MKVYIEDGKIFLECDYHHRELAKAIPCYKWDNQLGLWRYPLTVPVARAMQTIIGGDALLESPCGRGLIQMVREHDEHQRVKLMGNLPDHPSRTPSWNHQKQAYQFALPLRSAGIFMEMGTGKTKVAVDLMSNRKHRKILVLCPKRVIGVWGREIPKHAREIPRSVLLNKGTSKRKVKLLQGIDSPDPVVVVANYDAVWREPLASELLKFGFDMVVCDEMHRIKSPNGKASKFVAKIGQKAEYRLGLTGTPMPHSPADIYAQYRFLEPTVFGTNYTKFLSRYAVMGGYEGRQIVAFKNKQELYEKVYEIAFRVRSKDVLDLPEPIFETVEFDLNPSSKKIYKTLLKEAVAEYGDKQVVTDNILTQFLRLQQITSGFLPGGDGVDIINNDKIKVFKDLLEDIDKDEPITVFYRFKQDAVQMRQVVEEMGRECYEISGSVDDLEVWKGRINGSVILVQIQSGGEGEDFTKSRYTIYYSLTFSLKDYEQSKFRTLRPGQTRQPIYYHLVATETLDEHIMKSLQQKRDVVSDILERFSI